jgi:hypothetical protein
MPTRILVTPGANALWDFTGVQSFEEGSVPFDIVRDPASYRLYRAVDGPNGTVVSASTDFWTQAVAGPRFESVANLGSGVRRIDVEARLLIPSSISGDSTNNLFRIGTNNYAINLNLSGTSEWFCNGFGSLSVGGSSRTPTWDTAPNTYSLSRDTWVTLRVDTNVNTGVMTSEFYVNGALISTGTIPGAAGDIDGGTTKIVLMSRQNGGGGVDMAQNVQCEYIDVNINGSDYGRVEGDAATVNALTTPFLKAGDNAT